jgi:hypothetical protein
MKLYNIEHSDRISALKSSISRCEYYIENKHNYSHELVMLERKKLKNNNYLLDKLKESNPEYFI